MRRIAADYDRLDNHNASNDNDIGSNVVRMAADHEALTNRTQGYILATHVILDPKTRKSVAIIRNGHMFRYGKERIKVATVNGSYVYDLNANLVGHLYGGGRYLT
jgi:hypothetical protein